MMIFNMLLCGLAHAEYMSVRVPVANIRSGPDDNSELLWKVEQNHPLDIIEKKGGWCRFRDFEGDEGWVSASLLEKTPAVITKVDNCNVRSGPGLNYRVVFTVEKGIPFKVLKREGKWIHIQHSSGDSGWIYSALVWP
jgi:SH3-like domain-containing protein